MIYPATSLIGGATGSLDSIDGDILVDGDACVVVTDSGVYWYHLNATSSATENSPFRINPDTNAGTKSWHLVGTTARIGALTELTSDQSISNSTNTIISWDAVEYDDADFWAIGDPTKLVIPIGVTAVKVVGNIKWAAMTGRAQGLIMKNGSAVQGSPESWLQLTTSAGPGINLASGILEVSSADYFELRVTQYSGGAINVSAREECWFSIEAVGFA